MTVITASPGAKKRTAVNSSGFFRDRDWLTADDNSMQLLFRRQSDFCNQLDNYGSGRSSFCSAEQSIKKRVFARLTSMFKNLNYAEPDSDIATW